jgi:hypothetical protein
MVRGEVQDGQGREDEEEEDEEVMDAGEEKSVWMQSVQRQRPQQEE